MDYSLKGIRWLRVFGAALAVIVLSFLLVTLITAVYAFILAFQAGGRPDQAAISHFAAKVSRWLMPLLEMFLTFFASATIARKADNANIIHGLFVGIIAGLLSLAVTLTFGNQLNLHNIVFFLIVIGLGWLGGFVGKKRKSRI